MRIALCGGAGFIGHHLALRLREDGHAVLIADHLGVNNHLNLLERRAGEWTDRYMRFVWSRSALWNDAGCDFAYIDATDYHNLSRKLSAWKPDAIVHLAAVAHITVTRVDQHLAFVNSIITLKNALDVAHACNVERFVYFSSSTVYGDFRTDSVDEESGCFPDTTYGAYKLAGELFVKSAWRDRGVSYTVVRPQALYGPRCVSRRVTQIFIENALDKKPLRINGDGTDKHDFTYIDDLTDGVARIFTNMDASKNEIFCLTAGEARSTRNLAEIVNSHIPCVIEHGPPDPEKPSRGTMSPEKAKRLLGWKPKYDLDRGMERYINWYESELYTGTIRNVRYIESPDIGDI